MLTKSMIAIAAVVTSLAALSVGNAEARTSNDFNVGVPTSVGSGAFYGAGYGAHYAPSITIATSPAYRRAVAISCGQARNIVMGNGFYNVTAIDCSAPSYKFVAWQDGTAYRVRINGWGNITGVSQL